MSRTDGWALSRLPGCELASLLDVVGVVAGGRVPQHGEGVDGEGERDGPLHCEAYPVAGLADPTGLFRIFDADFD